MRRAVDTGADYTLIQKNFLTELGYDLADTQQQISITTASDDVVVPLIAVQRLTALGQTVENLEVIAHTMPLSMKADGLLGLDFFRGLELHLDFRFGQIELK